MYIPPTVSSASSPAPQGHQAISAAAREARATASGNNAAAPANQAQALQQVQAHLQAQAPVQAPPDSEKLETAIQSVREFVKPTNSNIEFSVDDDSGQLVVKIIDRSTKEVIRQMPSEEMMAIAKTLDSIKGLFVTQTA
ncbi:flagellar protein FlaG [Candidatus Accumulibacter phosphatis]|uniref:Flagellar protein FlaG n=1 Tax=Candidatus Accumulibacter phosphatis TaxID=327160 RepID=A0ABX1TZ18_9PROT|nr:flagellar protein FlaG [Candidatus Accumulibacter phosphatis]NMQ27903.1 flagellar protein FlaG [Candidatus Accumulibacter phosphatis]